MKKITILFISLCLMLMLTACRQSEGTFSDNIIEKPSSESIAADTLYNKFLSKKVNAIDKNGNTITLDEYFNNESKNIYHQYAIYDMNGDDIPELIIKTVKGLDIFWIKNDKVTLWYQGTNYTKPLNNMALLSERKGTAPEHTDYIYTLLDYQGDEIFRMEFSRYSPAEIYGVQYTEKYYINNTETTKELYDVITQPLLTESDNKIVWNELK